MSFSRVIKSIRLCEHCHGKEVHYQITADYRNWVEEVHYRCEECGFTWIEETKF